MAGFAPVFDRIGHQLDAAIAQPSLDHYFTDEIEHVIVAISDARWHEAVLFTAYRMQDIEPLITQARSVLDPTVSAERIGLVWLKWGRLARKGVKTGAAILQASPDLQVGSLLACFPEIQRQLCEIAATGAIPTLAVALNSKIARSRPIERLRAVAFPLPRWALGSGVVAGRA